MKKNNQIILYNEVNDDNDTPLAIDLKTKRCIKLIPRLCNSEMYYVSNRFLTPILERLQENIPFKGNFFETILSFALIASDESSNKVFLYDVPIQTLYVKIISLPIYKRCNFEFIKYFTMGKLDIWNELLSDISNNDVLKKSSKDCKFGSDCVLDSSVKIGEKSSFKKCLIGRHCIIEDNVKILNSIIMDHVTVQSNSTIKDSILMSNSYVNKNSQILGKVFSDIE